MPSFYLLPASVLGRYEPNKAYVLRLITVAVDVLAGRMENLGKDSRGEPKDAIPVQLQAIAMPRANVPALKHVAHLVNQWQLLANLRCSSLFVPFSEDRAERKLEVSRLRGRAVRRAFPDLTVWDAFVFYFCVDAKTGHRCSGSLRV
jgi:hypothetical protein